MKKKDTLQGVGLILYCSGTGRLWTVKELVAKLAIGKVAGMISFPLETMKPKELPVAALKRLCWEEMGIKDPNFVFRILGKFHPVPNRRDIGIFIFLASVDEEVDMFPVDTDIEAFGWVTPEHLLDPENLVRGEVRPVLQDLLSKKKRSKKAREFLGLRERL